MEVVIVVPPVAEIRHGISEAVGAHEAAPGRVIELFGLVVTFVRLHKEAALGMQLLLKQSLVIGSPSKYSTRTSGGKEENTKLKGFYSIFPRCDACVRIFS